MSRRSVSSAMAISIQHGTMLRQGCRGLRLRGMYALSWDLENRALGRALAIRFVRALTCFVIPQPIYPAFKSLHLIWSSPILPSATTSTIPTSPTSSTHGFGCRCVEEVGEVGIVDV